MRPFTNIDLDADHIGAIGPGMGAWIVEALIDSGQRLTSNLVARGEAITMAEEMRTSAMTTVVTLINAITGQAYVRAGVNLWAGKHMPSINFVIDGGEGYERALIAEACR